MKMTRKLLLLLLLVVSISSTVFAIDLTSTRQTIYYPSSSTQTTISASTTIPTATDNHASYTGNELIVGTNYAASSGFARSVDTIDLMKNDYQWSSLLELRRMIMVMITITMDQHLYYSTTLVTCLLKIATTEHWAFMVDLPQVVSLLRLSIMPLL